MSLVFVYGTLKRGRHNHSLIKHCEFMGEAFTDKSFTLYDGHLPMLKKEAGEGCKGELYLVDGTDLEQLDWLEGHPRHYKRTLITVTDVETRAPIKAWVYIYQGNVDFRVKKVLTY